MKPEPVARASHNRPAKRSLALVLALCAATIAGCYTYVSLPGEVREERLSPPYALQVLNSTGSPFSIEPSSFGRRNGFPAQPVANGESFEIRMQIRAFRVGATDRTGARQVLDAPYIAQEGGNTAVIRVRQNALHPIKIDLDSDRWFSSDSPPMNGVVPLRMDVKDFGPKRWFLSGPG